MKMGAFLSVAKGSCELPYLLEMKYFGASSKDQAPLVFVGKGQIFELECANFTREMVNRLLSFCVGITFDR